jgi:Stress responsive A/B Barrel Domain
VSTPSVVHVVLVRWGAGITPAALKELSVTASAFVQTIPGVLAVHCGANTSPEGLGGGFDWALIVSFSSREARDGYLPHPAHQPIAEQISRLADEVVVYDVDA